jgi:hypothetical protein
MAVGSKHVRRRCTVVELSNVRLIESPFTGKQVKLVIFPAHLDVNCCYVCFSKTPINAEPTEVLCRWVSCGGWVCCAGGCLVGAGCAVQVGVSCGSWVVSAGCGVPRGPNMDRK